MRSPFVAAIHLSVVHGKTKTLLTLGKQGGGNLVSIRYLLTFLSKFVLGVCPPYDLDRPRLNTQPWLSRL